MVRNSRERQFSKGSPSPKKLGAKVTAVMITEPLALMVGEAVHREAIVSNARSVLATVREAAEKSSVACETIHAKNQTPAEGIIQTAQEKRCDLIVMSSHSRRLTRVLMGRQATKVLAYSSPCANDYREHICSVHAVVFRIVAVPLKPLGKPLRQANRRRRCVVECLPARRSIAPLGPL